MIKSTNQIELFTQNYLVKNNKANVLIIHGLHEHCGRYEHVAQSLNALDINVYTFDLRGHGKSGGPKSIIKDIDEYRQDVENVYRSIPKDKPFFIVGHSMGGLIAVHFLMFQERNDVTGVILSGAALEIGKDITPFTIKAVQFIGKYLPNLKTSKLNPLSISRDQNEVEKYKNDTLIVHEGAKAGLGLALLEGIKDIKTTFSTFNYPLLIMHGGADQITNPVGSTALYDQSISKDKTLKIWDGAYHEIFNEINKTEVIDYMNTWIKKRI